MSSSATTADVQSLFAELEEIQHGLAAALEAGEGIEVGERRLWDELLAFGRKILAAALENAGNGDLGSSIVLERDGQRVIFERRGLEEIPLRTVFGTVTVRRYRYVGLDGECIYPLDADLLLSQKHVSPLLQRWIVQLAHKSAYGEVQADLAEIFGLSMSVRTLENTVAYRAEDAWTYREEASVEPAQPDKLLVVNFDAKGVTIRREEKRKRRKKPLPGQKANKRKMATVATVHETDPIEHDIDELASMDWRINKQRPRAENKLVWADLEDRQLVLAEVRRHVEQRMRPDTQVVIGIDGCPKLEAAVRRHFEGIDAIYVLDWYHLSEYLWDAAKTLVPQDADARYEKMVRRILAGEASKVVAGLKQSLTKRGDRGLSLVKKAVRYLESHAHMMAYDRAIELGVPIATGAVEGACAHVVRSRMQRPGMRWSIPGAQALLQLRAIQASKLGEAHHQWFRLRETRRLHGWRELVTSPDRYAA